MCLQASLRWRTHWQGGSSCGVRACPGGRASGRRNPPLAPGRRPATGADGDRPLAV